MVVTQSMVTRFQVREAASGKLVFEENFSPTVEDADSGDRIQPADFTRLEKSGRYYIEVPGLGRSWNFEVGPNVFARAYYLTMRSFYGQRCGTAVDMGPEFPGFKHAACHLEGAYHQSSGKSGAKTTVGGWHDAGDYGRYIVNSGISTGTLLWAHEMFGDAISKVKLDIPESKNRTPDILDEIRWNLDWMLSMQDDDGGVWHKQTSEKFCGFVMPEKDTLVSYVIGTGAAPYKSTCAGADFAAVMAVAARAYRPFDKAYSVRTLAAARKAWAWVEKNPNVLFRNPAGVSTGGYGDGDCSDERLWAAAELYRTTGEDAYHQYFLANWQAQRKALREVGPPSWPTVGAMGLWTYVLGKGKNAEAFTAIRGDSLAAADKIVDRAGKQGYRTAMTARDYVWGSNAVVANYGVQLLVANAMKRDMRYVNTALDNLHYLLGRNPFSLSYVSQLGENAFKHPHHRPSGADTNDLPWPGLLSGGPNARPQDPAMRKLGQLPPARMFIDDQESYASNEIAINWSAPLVFLVSGAMAHR